MILQEMEGDNAGGSLRIRRYRRMRQKAEGQRFRRVKEKRKTS